MTSPMDPSLVARTFGTGNEAYRRGDYGGALDAYLQAVEAGADTADLWHNVGNAYYRLGRRGEAALAWERALRRDPGDEEARANLALVRSEVSHVEVVAKPQPLQTRIASRVDGDLAAMLLLLAWALSCGLFVSWLRAIGRQGLRLVLGALLVTSLLLAAVGGSGVWAVSELRRAGWAVVVEDIQAKEAPDEGAEDAFSIPETWLVRIVREEGPWRMVEIAGGLTGWVPARTIAHIDGEH